MTFAVNIAQSGSNNVTMRNLMINGDMRIDQRSNGALVSGAAGPIYGVDRVVTGVFGLGTGRISAQQSSTAPAGFAKSLINTVTTADASPSDGYGYCVTQYIEGFNIADLGWGTANAQPVTLSFWVRSSITGTYMVSFINADITWGYATTYTISSANTWEYKTITIVGPTSGSWNTTNLRGIGVALGLGGGANRQATLNSWYAPTGTNTPTDASGCVDWIATLGATFYVTGFQLERGTAATAFEYRPYGTELALCQRYYQPFRSTYETTLGTTGTITGTITSFLTAMRASPTMTVTAEDGSGGATLNSMGTTGTTGSGVYAYAMSLTISTSGYAYRYVTGNASAEL